MRVVHGTFAFALAVTMAAPAPVHGAAPVWTVVAPASVQPGSIVRIDLVGLNPGFGERLRFDASATLSATFTTPTASYPVTLTGTSAAPVEVEPRAFAARAYSMTVPDAPEGDAILIVAAGHTEIAATMRVARDGTTESRGVLTSPGMEAFPRTLPGRLGTYQPNYFIYGSDKESAAKFQLSLKYRLLTFGEGSPDRARPSLQLSYTQRSLWDITGPSSPFYDTSYMPELFVEYAEPARGLHQMHPLGWAFGYRHESNGKGGDDSRSCDVVYARGHFAAGSVDTWYFAVTPEIWHYLGGGEVEKYRGSGKLQFLVGHRSGPSLVWSVTPEHGFEHLTSQIDLSLPVGVRRVNFGTYLLVQYFDGYAESLLDYTHKSRTLRAGIALVR